MKINPLGLAWQWFYLILSTIVFDLLGLIVVAVAIPFAVEDTSVSDGRSILNLPKWAFPWRNDFDGLLGDKRGDWAKITPFGVDVNSWLAKYWWAAIRNPSNNLRRLQPWSAPVQGATCNYWGKAEVNDRPGEGGLQFVVFSYYGNFPGRRYGLYWVHEFGNGRGFVVRLGFKIDVGQIGSEDEPKGYVMKINPWKEL